MSITNRLSLVALVFHSLVSVAWAIDGPGVSTITNADWGSVLDFWPHVVRVEIDLDLDGNFSDWDSDGATFCTGTLIAPDAIATAGHCFDNNGSALDLGNNAAIPAGSVRANFGPGAPTQFILNSGGRTDKVLGPSDPSSTNDFAIVNLVSTAPFSPIPALPRNARVGDTNYAIGYGVHGPNNTDNADRVGTTPAGGFPQHTNGAKNWATITVDAVTGVFDANGNALSGTIEQVQASPEDWTEGGDSGGPGIQVINTMPNRAWGSSVGLIARGDFIMSTVSGGRTPDTNDSSDSALVDYDDNLSTTDDFWTRMDAQANFINARGPISMRPDTVEIFHNLPDDPSTIAPGDTIAVFVRASWAISRGLGVVSDYLLDINVWEEDVQLLSSPVGFGGDVDLRPTNFADDLAGFGFSAGSFAAGETDVVAWDIQPASAIIPFDEAGNALDPPLDWIFQINYGDANQYMNSDAEVTLTTQATIDAEIATALANITGGTAVRGGLAIVPEPGSFLLISLALLSIMLCRTRDH